MRENKAQSTIIRRETLRDQVYNELRKLILANQLPAGERINEVEVAKQLGVSVTPVREALNLLRGDGLVVSDPWQGSRVRSFTDQDVSNVLRIRCVLESMAVEQAYPNFTDEDLQTLDGIQSQYALQYEKSLRDYQRIASLNSQFHNYLVEKSGNRFLTDILREIANYETIIKAPITRESDGKDSIREHNEMLAALRKKDPHGAVLWMKRHIERITEELLKVRHKK